jgi:RimJ/RimL family protein N-acetyltransferase
MTRLRPIDLDDVAFLEQQYSSLETAGEFNWFGPGAGGRLKKLIKTNQDVTRERGALAVIDEDATLVGDVSWHRVDHAPPPHGWCWNIGAWIHPDYRGKGHGTRAQVALVEYLFAHFTFERIEASTEADNVAEQRALEKAGFRREGLLRRASLRDGVYRDMVMFSILRDEL